MPRFSLVVPAHHAQGLLRTCLESVLAQSFGDVEVIVVAGTGEGANLDVSGAVARECAAADPRVRVVEPAVASDPAPAQDAGAGGGASSDVSGAIGHECAPADPRGDGVDLGVSGAVARECAAADPPVVKSAQAMAPGHARDVGAASEASAAVVARGPHSAQPVAPGHARDVGAAQARGDYLLFLDPADLLAPGALAAADARLSRAGDPDLLLLGHEYLTVLGEARPGGDHDVLAALGEAVTTAADRPDLLALRPGPATRLIRRDFFTGHAFRFAAGDLDLANHVLLAADRVAGLDRVCVRHRERPERGDGLDVLERYEELFAQVAGEDRRAALRRQAAGVLAGIAPGISESGRREFVRRAGRLLAAYRPADPAGAGGEVGEWLHAVGSGSWPRFRLVTAGRAARARAGARVRGARRVLRGRALRAWYRLRLRRRLDPHLVVYAAYWNRGVFCNPAAIARKAADLAPHLKAVWVVGSADRDRLPPGTAHVVAGSARYWDVMARAGFLVNNAGFPGAVVKRPGQVYLQTHHGTPLKLMGTDLYDRPAAAAAMDFPRLLEHARQWDVSLVANRHSAEVWERVYPGGHRTLPSGYPRNDVLWTAGAAEVRAARAALGLAPGTTAILYAPTHRDHRRRFTLPLDPVRLSRDLGPGHTLLVRAHYFYDGHADLTAPHEPGQVIDVSGHGSVEELCLAADALLTDYSSLMFDYAALDRPIVVHAPDWDAYRAARGVYFDLLSGKPGETPGVIARDQAEVAAAFRSGAHRGPEAAALRAAFRQRFCAYDDGLAAERVVRHVLLGEPALLPHRPLHDRCPAPTPEAADRAGTVASA